MAALKEFHAEVTTLKFPYTEQAVTMHVDEEEKLREALDKTN